MICDNCGAGYHLNEYYCPYCQSENPVMAEVRKEKILKGYDIEAEQMKEKIWAENLHKWTKRIVILMSLFAVLAVVLAIGVPLVAPVIAEQEYEAAQKHLAVLDDYYQKQEYEKMDDYIWDKGLYGRYYEKYEQVADVHEDWKRALEAQEFIQKLQTADYYDAAEREEMLSMEATRAIRYAAYTILDSRKAKNDRVILGNEDILQDFYLEAIQFMEAYGITEENLLVFMNEDVIDSEDARLKELGKQFVEKLMQQ